MESYFLTDDDLSKPHVCGFLDRHYGTCPACEAVMTLKYFLTDDDLSVPHVCGVLARHYGTCPACEAVMTQQKEMK